MFLVEWFSMGYGWVSWKPVKNYDDAVEFMDEKIKEHPETSFRIRECRHAVGEICPSEKQNNG